MCPTFIRRAKSIAGAALVGIGSFIFYGNLDRAATQLGQLLGTSREAVGLPATFTFAAAQLSQAYAGDHLGFLQILLRHILLASWPLLLVIVGMVLSRGIFTDDSNPLRKKKVLRICRTACRSFDVKVETK